CTADQGCRFCLAKCPVEALSVDFIDSYPVVDVAKCVGCGICDQVCSTVNDRIAIKVVSGRRLETAPKTPRQHWSGAPILRQLTPYGGCEPWDLMHCLVN